MKKILLALVLLGVFSTPPAYAEETMGEKTKEAAKDTKRSVKKGYHRVKEKICMKGDSECLAQKAKHRAEEAKDAVKDKASEVKEEID